MRRVPVDPERRALQEARGKEVRRPVSVDVDDDDAALVGLSTDNDGLAFEGRVEELFDGNEEGVHVDVEVGLHW